MLIHIKEPNDVLPIRRILSALEDPTDQLIDALCSPLDKYIGSTMMSYHRHGKDRGVRDDLKRFAKLMEPPKNDVPDNRHWMKWVGTNYDDGFTATEPKSFRLGVWVCPVSSWADLARHVSSVLQHEHPDAFEDTAMKLRGQHRSYFSADKDRLTKPTRVNLNYVYVETNLSANNAFQFARDLVSEFGFSSEEFAVQVR